MSSLGIPLDIEVADISIGLNSVILFIFLMGIYTVIYFGTIYIYFTKNPFKYHPVPAAVTVLYLSGIAETAVQWFSLKWQFVDNGESRDSVFFTLLDIPQWANIVSNVSGCIIFVIADGLLIWRCIYVWNCSLRIISPSLILIITEFALFLTQVSLNVKFSRATVSPALATRLNNLNAAAYFMCFTTTLVMTALISYRIYSVSNEGASTGRFKRIIDIVIQSGAVYALSQLVSALGDILAGSQAITHTRKFGFVEYGQLVNVAIAAISPTVMVARVALLSPDTTYPTTSVHLSGLQFHAHSTSPTVNMERIEPTHSIEGDRNSAPEKQAVEAKV